MTSYNLKVLNLKYDDKTNCHWQNGQRPIAESY